MPRKRQAKRPQNHNDDNSNVNSDGNLHTPASAKAGSSTTAATAAAGAAAATASACASAATAAATREGSLPSHCWASDGNTWSFQNTSLCLVEKLLCVFAASLVSSALREAVLDLSFLHSLTCNLLFQKGGSFFQKQNCNSNPQRARGLFCLVTQTGTGSLSGKCKSTTGRSLAAAMERKPGVGAIHIAKCLILRSPGKVSLHEPLGPLRCAPNQAGLHLVSSV